MQRTETRMLLRDPLPGIDNVIFMSDDQITMLNRTMTSLGGTKRFAPAAVMATPNQPAGPALDVLAFWRRFFPCRQGHWFGWEFEAYPRLRVVEFLNAEHTRAIVPVTIGYSGATVFLEKDRDGWHTRTQVDQWIT